MRRRTQPPPPDPTLIALGKLVRRARARAWMSQRVFGLHVGLDQSSVSRLEGGKLHGIRLYRLAPVLLAIGLIPLERPAVAEVEVSEPDEQAP